MPACGTHATSITNCIPDEVRSKATTIHAVSASPTPLVTAATHFATSGRLFGTSAATTAPASGRKMTTDSTMPT